MKKLFVLIFTSFLVTSCVNAQKKKEINMTDQTQLPYYEIPAYPENYTAGTVAARVIDGLGFRYFWATEGLREEDLKYSPGNDGRSAEETLDHIYGLSNTIVNAATKMPNISSADRPKLSWEEKRRKTLENIHKASQLLKNSTAEEVAASNIVFQRGERSSEFPFWNLLNGPIADAIHHVGQIVSYRRSSGNPINPKVSVFTGKKRE